MATEEQPEVLPLHSEFGTTAVQPYVFDLEVIGVASEHMRHCMAFVIMTRKDGLLLAVPELALSAEALDAGELAGETDLLGPHLRAELEASSLDEDALDQEPVPVPGRTVPVVIVDFSLAALIALKPLTRKEELESIFSFEMVEPALVPNPNALVETATTWTRAQGPELGERVMYYSADEVPETPRQDVVTPPRSTRPKATAPRGGGDTGKANTQPSPKKKVTVATLAESVEVITKTLPTLVAQCRS